MRRSWSLPTVAFLTAPLCDPWLLTQPPVNNWFFFLLACDSIVDSALHLVLTGGTNSLDASRCSIFRTVLYDVFGLVGTTSLTEHFTCGRNKIGGRSHEGDETGLQRLNNPRAPRDGIGSGNEVAGRQVSAISISTLNHGHGHLEIVTCDSQSLAGAFATVAMED